MPTGGLYALVAYGAQDVLLSGNPDFTYFYKVYKKYSHFSEESVTFTMDGPQDLSYDQPIQIRFKIQRVADLVRDMYFTFNLPDIYCKFIELNEARQAQYNFSWVDFIGCTIIQKLQFNVGGQKIQEFDGTYMIAKAQADLDNRSYRKWSELVGNVPELTDPAQGLYAGGSDGTGYPLVYNNNGPAGSNLNNVNRPSIFGREISVPLPFWFTESTFEALPLVSLQYMECDVQIILRPIKELYRILDPSGNPVAPGYLQQASPQPLQPGNIYYTTQSDISDVLINNFLTDIGVPKPLLNTWQLNPRIQATYVYLTDEERAQFSSNPLQYLLRQVTAYNFQGITSRQLVELQTHNPITRLLIISRRSDSVQNRNQIANFTNWINPLKVPYIPPAFPYPPFITQTSATGQYVLNGQRNILQTLRVVCDGTELQESKPVEYFQRNVSWKYLAGIPDEGIIIYPFALYSPSMQPDGSINSSRIKLFQVDLDVVPLPQNTLYNYDFTVYVENYNWLTLSSGLAGLKYAL